MHPIPADLLALVQQTAPPEAEIVPLTWAYEDETYNIAVVVLDIVTADDVWQEVLPIPLPTDFKSVVSTIPPPRQRWKINNL